jgi:hypothetical protein
MHAWRCLRSALVWAEGHYNGAIRTRKTTVHQPGGEGAVVVALRPHQRAAQAAPCMHDQNQIDKKNLG